MIYYYFDLTLLLLLLIVLLYVIQKELRTDGKAVQYIVLSTVLTLAFKYNWGTPFWGLEYEDAYAFSFCSRQFSYNIYPSSFLVDAITIGSLQEPIAMGTYGGHFITYSTFLSIFTQLFGWSFELLCIVNCAVSFFIMLILSLMFKTSKNWFIAPILYCCAPIINVFTTCMLSETFSSFICLIFVFAFWRRNTWSVKLLKYIAFFVALLCKRENLILCIFPALDALLCLKQSNVKNSIREVLYISIPYVSLIMVYFFSIQNVLEIEKIESADIGMPTFSISYFIRLFPVFVKSLLSPFAFSICILVCIYILGLHLFKQRKITKQTIYPIVLFLMYLLLYSSHYRGWFFIQGTNVNEFETYRYINNFYFLLIVSTGSVCCFQTKKVLCFLLMLLGFSFYETKVSRQYYYNIEQKCRFDEVNEVLDVITKNGTKEPIMLICDNILLYQDLCPDNFYVCDIRYINNIDMKDNLTYFFVASDLNYLQKRYRINVDTSKFEQFRTLSSGNIIYKMTE